VVVTKTGYVCKMGVGCKLEVTRDEQAAVFDRKEGEEPKAVHVRGRGGGGGGS